MHYEKSEGDKRKSAIKRRREIVMRASEEAMAFDEEENKNKIQAKLEISGPEDAQEKEADEVARKVVDGGDAKTATITSANNTVSTKSESGSGLYADDQLQRSLDSSKGSGQTMDDATKGEMETKMGADFSGVKIHTDSAAHTMSEDINAKAFTHGQDIYFKNGNYDPGSGSGKNLLAHELHHTRQNSAEGGVQRKVWRKDDPKSLHSIRGLFDSPMTEGIADSYQLINSTSAGKIYVANNILRKEDGSIATKNPEKNPHHDGPQQINLNPGYYIRYSRQIKIEPAEGGEIYIVIEGATTPGMIIGADPDKMTSEQLLTLHGKTQLSYSIKGINSSKKWFYAAGKTTSTLSSLYLLINQNTPGIKKLLDYVALDQKYMANAIALVNTNPGFEPIIKTDEDVEFLLGRRGTEMSKVGIIAQNDFKVKFTPVPRQKNIDILGYNFRMPISARVIVLREYNGWFFIRSFDGKSGWVEGYGLAFDPPEATAALYEVKSNDNLFNLVKTYYGLGDKEDKRLYVNAVVYANRASGRKKQFKDTATPGLFEVNDQYHHNPVLIKGTTLWLPSQQFIDALKASGKISSGSFSEAVWNTAKQVIDVLAYIVQFIIAFIGGLVAGFVMSIVDTIVSIVELVAGIVKMIVGIFTGETISQAKELYEAFKNLTWADFKMILAELGQAVTSELEAYWKKLTSENPWEAGYTWGYLVGYIIGLIVITYFTAGSGLVARIGAKLAKILGKAWTIILRILAKMSKLKKKIPLKKLKKLVTKKKVPVATPVTTVIRHLYKVSAKMRKKILWGEQKKTKDIIGGHFRGIIGHPNYVTQYVGSSSLNPGCDIYKFIKGLPGNVISNIKTSTFFPKGWSTSKIIVAIEEVANNPFKTEIIRSGVLKLQKKVDGIWIQVIIENGEITAGYPLKAASELIP